MTGLAVQIPDEIFSGLSESIGRSSGAVTTKNALARLVRRAWPAQTVKQAQAFWDLTEGEAKGVVYATASQATLDKIKRHRNGGWRLTLAIDALVIGRSLQDFIIEETERARERIETRRRRLRQMEALAASLDAVGGGLDA